MKINKEGLEIIKKWEGCRLNAYRCPSGVLTIGYGHTGNDVKSGMKITKHKAEQLLLKDIKKFENVVNKYNEIYDFNENEFSSLVSFAFNIGNIDQLTNNGKRSKEAISSKLTLYCRANGKYLSGLYNRRLDEQRLFNTPVVSGNIGRVIAPSGLNIRETPSTNSKILKAIPFGNKLEIVERLESGWLHINYGDVNGYVYGKWVI